MLTVAPRAFSGDVRRAYQLKQAPDVQTPCSILRFRDPCRARTREHTTSEAQSAPPSGTRAAAGLVSRLPGRPGLSSRPREPGFDLGERVSDHFLYRKD